MHYDESDAILRFNIITGIIKSRCDLSSKEWVPAAETVYEFVTKSGNSPARKKETDDEIPF